MLPVIVSKCCMYELSDLVDVNIATCTYCIHHRFEYLPIWFKYQWIIYEHIYFLKQPAHTL